jgi:TetR/AcrR family transcriptional repressor of nem operon
VEGSLDRSRPCGCLVTNSVVELSRSDRGATAKVGDSLAKLEVAFLGALERARAKGELASTEDLRALARFLTSSAQALSVMAKAVPDARCSRMSSRSSWPFSGGRARVRGSGRGGIPHEGDCL